MINTAKALVTKLTINVSRALVLQAFVLLVFGAFVASSMAIADSSREALWQETLSEVRDDFPRVRHISTEDLANLLAERSDFALLDTRESEEFEVSHIKGATLVEDFSDALDALQNRRRDELVVVYCSVGYRSSKLANKLARRGFSNVVNVEGSLFKWANEDRPIYRDDELTSKVHPYDEDWGQLLDRKFLPDSR